MTLFEYLKNLGYSDFEARGLIMASKVRVNHDYQSSLKYVLKDTDKVYVKESKPYVSRGAEKLKSAFKNRYEIIQDAICLDVGASTGGFTEYLINHGAKHVYALDVGTNQLAYKLRIDERVTSLEKTNFKQLDNFDFVNQIEIIVADVSFISLNSLVEIIRDNLLNLKLGILLFKPQFEAPRNLVQDGFVDEKYHQDLLNNFSLYLENNDFKIIEIIPSEVKGKKKTNQEYFFIFERN